MHLFFKYICFSWILSNVNIANDDIKEYPDYISVGADDTLTEECPAEKFNITNVDHSSLLVIWDPEELYQGQLLRFLWYPYPNKDTLRNNHSDVSFGIFGHFKIPFLKENTSYRIEIKISLTPTCWIVGKTLKKNYSLLTKPDFEFSLDGYKDLPPYIQNFHQPKVRIKWLPCGRKGYCEENEVGGSHFSIKYKMLTSRQEWKVCEYERSNKYIFGLLPGRQYEVVVTSISGNLETDSDPKEVFSSIIPGCSPVRFVKIITLTNSSVLVSWKPPKQCEYEIVNLDYVVLSSIFDSSPMIFLNYSYNESPYNESKIGRPTSFTFNQTRISNLTAGTRYTFFIIPQVFNAVYGFEYRIDYTAPQDSQSKLALAKPDFEHVIFPRLCYLVVLWLPCGQTYNCNNTRPGSHFLVKYSNINDGVEEISEEKVADRLTIPGGFYRNQTYKVSVQSVDEFGSSEFATKFIQAPSDCYV